MTFDLMLNYGRSEEEGHIVLAGGKTFPKAYRQSGAGARIANLLVGWDMVSTEASAERSDAKIALSNPTVKRGAHVSA